MKRNNKLKIIIPSIAVVLLTTFSSCLKNSLPLETDFSHLQDHVEIVKSGLTNFSSAGVLFGGADTVSYTLTISLASVNLPTSPVNVTIGVDAPQIATYNAANSTNFQIVPTGSYIIGATSLTIPAGQQYAQTTVSFIADSLDPTVSYMLPISITDASGKALTSNLNTAYYHLIGNPIAGVYDEYFSRWLAGDSTGGAASAQYYQDDVGPVVLGPNSPTEVQVTSGGLGEVNIIDFINTAGVLSNFTVSVPPISGVNSNTNGVIQADPDHGYYRITYYYVNTSGATRTVVNEYVKQ